MKDTKRYVIFNFLVLRENVISLQWKSHTKWTYSINKTNYMRMHENGWKIR